MDRLRYHRGTRLIMGNALVARLLHSLRARAVPILFEIRLDELTVEGGRVTGAVLQDRQGRRAVRARKGVVIATGGIAWNAELRTRLFPQEARRFSLAPESNTGDGITAALQVGAGLDDDMVSPALWMPSSVMRRSDETFSVYPHIILDRAKPGLIAVNRAGLRFVNEADSYHDFVAVMLRGDERGPNVPAHLICDGTFIRAYGIGLIHPRTRDLKPFLRAGYLKQADTISVLAQTIGVDANGLEETIARHNRFAAAGTDEEFGRGSNPLNRFNGDASHGPNPCLRHLGPGPYFAVTVWPADLAGSAGLSTDQDARVLNDDGSPIDGLYAAGADAASIFRGTYPGPGTMIGPAIVFGWRAAMHAAGTPGQRGTP
jgi:succinate dehydrogenase/fumarate reductase flavoprotein subunit